MAIDYAARHPGEPVARDGDDPLVAASARSAERGGVSATNGTPAPLGPPRLPGDIAAAVAYLASDDAAWSPARCSPSTAGGRRRHDVRPVRPRVMATGRGRPSPGGCRSTASTGWSRPSGPVAPPRRAFGAARPGHVLEPIRQGSTTRGAQHEVRRPVHTFFRKLVRKASPPGRRPDGAAHRADRRRAPRRFAGRGEADLYQAFARPPNHRDREMLGVPARDTGRFKGWSDAWVAAMDRPTPKRSPPDRRDARVPPRTRPATPGARASGAGSRHLISGLVLAEETVND